MPDALQLKIRWSLVIMNNDEKLQPAIAQLVEHLTVERCSYQMVPGSIPGGRIFAAQPTEARTQINPTSAPKDGTPGFEQGTC